MNFGLSPRWEIDILIGICLKRELILVKVKVTVTACSCECDMSLHTLRPFHYVRHKRSLGLQLELIRIWRSKAKGRCDLTWHIFFCSNSHIHTVIRTKFNSNVIPWHFISKKVKGELHCDIMVFCKNTCGRYSTLMWPYLVQLVWLAERQNPSIKYCVTCKLLVEW